jgi:AcrR family transcriptional regulator
MAGTNVHQTASTRHEQKKRTREALLDAASGLLENQNLSSLGLREVTRAVGIAPAAFYRHFRDMDELGAELVERSLGELLPVIRDARRDASHGASHGASPSAHHGASPSARHGAHHGDGDPDEAIRRTLDVLAAYVESHRGPFRIIARERSGGVALVRRAIADKLRQAATELADDLAGMPAYRGWQPDDITMIAGMFVNHVVQLSSTLLDVPADQPDEAERLISVARRQLQLIIVGRRHWLAERPRPERYSGPGVAFPGLGSEPA